jgi:hypothetical protein
MAEWARHPPTVENPMTKPSRITLILLSLAAAAIALFAAYAWVSLHMSYSEGERAGFLQKFSRKGWICKTWEGEILLSSMPGAIPERFAFTVRDDLVARQLMEAMGKRVQLTYSQHKGVPSACFGETEYFIDKVAIQP